MTQCFKAAEKAMKKAENANYAFMQALEYARTMHAQHDRAAQRVVDKGGLCKSRGRKALGFAA